MISVTGAPDGGTGSILLIDGAAYQDVFLECSATLDTNCDNAGLVFGYVDHENFWVLLYSKAQQKKLLYQVSSGTWTQRRSVSYSITGGSPFTMAINYLGSGGVFGYTATIPAGQVGLWCSDNSDNDFDDFKVQDIAGPFEVDGRWFSNLGDVRVDNSDNNVLETYGSCERWRTIVRRGFRADD